MQRSQPNYFKTSHAELLPKETKQYTVFMLVQSWVQNVFIEFVGNKFDSNEMVKSTDWPYILSDVQYWKSLEEGLLLELRYP